jgi:hypothetical protein
VVGMVQWGTRLHRHLPREIDLFLMRLTQQQQRMDAQPRKRR